MEGRLGTYDEPTRRRICERIERIAKEVGSAMGCKVEISIDFKYPAIVNPPKETDHIKRLACRWFGPQHISEDELPITASEDFSYFLDKAPGCFWALGTKKPGTNPGTLHSSDYDYNDDMIATAGYFYIRLLEDRLKVKIFKP